MRRFTGIACTLAIVLAATFTPAQNIARAVDATDVTITCGDGSAMTGTVTLNTLLALTQEVQTMTGCALSTDPSLAVSLTDQTGWTVYDYNPSGQAISPRKSPSSLPAMTSGATTTFVFKPDIFTALLTTTDRDLTGDLSATTLTDTVIVSGPQIGPFQYRDGDGCIHPANVRFYFTSARASGPSFPAPGTPVKGGLPPAGFYTQFWWSNPTEVQLSNGSMSQTITASLATAGNWSDWDGQNGATQLDAFMTAAANVKSVGLSFGGGCFFENGVTETGDFNEMFSSTFTEAP